MTTASSNTDFTWITEVAVTGTTSVVLDWTAHFFNHDHQVKGLLWEIKDHSQVSNGKQFHLKGTCSNPQPHPLTCSSTNLVPEVEKYLEALMSDVACEKYVSFYN